MSALRIAPAAAAAAAILVSACGNDVVMRLDTAPADPLMTSENGARIAAADVADGATTALGLAQTGIVEANPLFAWAGPAAPVIGIAGKYAIKSALIESGMPADRANHSVEVGSAFAACANVATIIGSAMPPALLAGVACGAAYASAMPPKRQTTRAIAVPYDQVPFEQLPE